MDEQSVTMPRNHLDAKIARLERELSSLKIERNEELAPILRLPPEIMSQIFRSWHDQCLPRPLLRVSDQRRELHWTSVTLICKKWNTIALNCSHLWGLITTARPLRWNEMLLIRSRDSPITVNMDFRGLDSPYMCNFLELIMPHTARINALQMSAHSNESEKLIHALLDCPMPALTTIRHTKLALFSPTLPVSFAASVFPQLKTVALGAPIDSSVLVHLRSITDLRLGEEVDALKERMPLTTLFKILNDMPLLRKLHLTRVVEYSRVDVVQPFALPRIVSLSLSDSTRHCSFFLDNVSLPSLDHLSLMIGSARSALKNLVPHIAEFWQRQLDRGTVADSLSASIRDDICVTKLVIGCSSRPHVEPIFTLRVSFEDYASWKRVLWHLTAEMGVALAKISTVHCLWEEKSWRKFLRDMPRIRSLHVGNEEGVWSIRTLGTAQMKSEQLLIPLLDTLVISDMIYDPSTFFDFVRWLAARKKHGPPLEDIIIRECHFLDNDWVDSMRVFAHKFTYIAPSFPPDNGGVRKHRIPTDCDWETITNSVWENQEEDEDPEY